MSQSSSQTFEVVSKYQPAGDQPSAIEQLVTGIDAGLAAQTLLGVTGSGKTFTIAQVIAKSQRPYYCLGTQQNPGGAVIR